MIIAFIILLILIIGVLGYLLYVSYKKYSTLLVYTEAYVQFISGLYFKLKNTKEQIDGVDKRGSFSSDDEIGFAFREIQESVDEVYQFITKYVNATTNQDEKEKTK